MPGRTLREAIRVALEVYPSAALSDPAMVDAVHVAVAQWVKDYSARLGLLIDDKDLVDDIDAEIAVARTKTPLGHP